MSVRLLATKLCTPLLRPNHVTRLVQRLNDRLFQPVFTPRLTPLPAPAGYGKAILPIKPVPRPREVGLTWPPYFARLETTQPNNSSAAARGVYG